jgi:hypothetical protein
MSLDLIYFAEAFSISVTRPPYRCAMPTAAHVGNDSVGCSAMFRV